MIALVRLVIPEAVSSAGSSAHENTKIGENEIHPELVCQFIRSFPDNDNTSTRVQV